MSDDMLRFDVVVATRNRPEALSLSLPLLLAQSRRPEKLIVIDSSDEHDPVVQAVEAAVAASDWSGRVIVEHSAKGLPYQRNRGLEHVTAPIVIFPDDDSLMWPGCAAAILRAYETDTEGQVAAVCAREAMAPPPELALEGAGYDMTGHHRREARTRVLRNRLEKRISALKPALYFGNFLKARQDDLPWMAAQNCRQVEYMTGFRMSFRTKAIQSAGFDARLRDYALDEDIEASFQAARSGMVIAARDALIYHHRFPGGRGNGRTLGAISILNRAYVLRKHLALHQVGPKVEKAVLSRLRYFVWLKLATSLAGLRSPFGRQTFAGAWAASRAVSPVLRCPAEELEQTYEAALRRVNL